MYHCVTKYMYMCNNQNWKMKKIVLVVPVVVGELGVVSKRLEMWIKKLDIKIRIELL